MNALFSSGSLPAQLAEHAQKADPIVDAVDPDLLLDRSDDENVVAVMQQYGVQPPVVCWERAWSKGPQEARIDMQHNFSYGGSGEGRPLLVPADKIAVH